MFLEASAVFSELKDLNVNGCMKCVEEWEKDLEEQGEQWIKCTGCPYDCPVRLAKEKEYNTIASIQLEVEEAVEGRQFYGIDE